jgi:hypothetical protein
MKVSVLMASGEVDEWTGVADANEDRGSLVVLDYIEGDEVPADAKLLMTRREIDQGPDLPPGEKVEVYKVLAVYAPGMWMKVEFE